MPRTTDSGLIAALTAPNLQPAIFVLLAFTSGPQYLWSGIGSVTWNGQTWTGLGPLLMLSPIYDGATVEARGISVTLSGLDSTLLPLCMSDFALLLPAAVYLGLYSGGSLISTPITAWAGRMDQPTIDCSGEDATITIALEDRLLDMNVAVDRRLTNQDQQMTWPGDLGLQFVDAVQEITVYWGQGAQSTNNL